jgi:hypothetical protein
MIVKALIAFVASSTNRRQSETPAAFSQSAAADLKQRGVPANPFEIGVALNTFYDVHIPRQAMWQAQFDLSPNGDPDHATVLAKLHQEMLDLQRTYDEQTHRTPEGRLANALLALAQRRLAISRHIRTRLRLTATRLQRALTTRSA